MTSNEQSVSRLRDIGRSTAGCLTTETGVVWHPANELLWAAAEIERLRAALEKAYALLAYAAPDSELVEDELAWMEECDEWLDEYAPSKLAQLSGDSAAPETRNSQLRTAISAALAQMTRGLPNAARNTLYAALSGDSSVPVTKPLGPPWEFDRYVNGRLKAEGIKINRALTFEHALGAAIELAGPHDVLVPHQSAVETSAHEILREGKCESCGKLWVVKGDPTVIVSVLAVHCTCGHVNK